MGQRAPVAIAPDGAGNAAFKAVGTGANGVVGVAVGLLNHFNVVHLGTMFKVDVFIMKGDSWSREEMSRVREEKVESLGRSIRFASPEDVLLHKLIWYKLGNEISDRQWGDILGVMRVQGDSLDQRY